MALGKLSFLCLNAVCLGGLGILVFGALLQKYRSQVPNTSSSPPPLVRTYDQVTQVPAYNNARAGIENGVGYSDKEPSYWPTRLRDDAAKEMSYER